MLTIVRTTKPWVGDASGDVLVPAFFREFKRGGATVASLSQEQWDGYFGILPMGNIDGLSVVLDVTLPKDEVNFFDEDGKLMGVMRNLYTVPKRDDAEGSEEGS